MKKNTSAEKNNKALIVSNFIFIIISIVLGVILVGIMTTKKDNNLVISRDEINNFDFTSPILDCENSNQDSNTIIFSSDLIDKVEEVKNNYSLKHFSLYFRDLNNGPWVGVKEKEIFSPASLLKVPVLMSFLSNAEKDKSILEKKVKITPSELLVDIKPNIIDTNTLVLGQEYTLNEVAESMIKRSDNTAVLTLFHNMDTSNIGNVFKSIGVPYKDLNTEVDISVKNYAGFFRVLYNSSYLSREMSEKALKIMSESDYKEGLVAGVPESVKVSHKFGERTIDNSKDTTQLHDCGIIYYPNKPYILCLMTRGNSFENQAKAIKELSKYVYDQVDKNK